MGKEGGEIETELTLGDILGRKDLEADVHSLELGTEGAEHLVLEIFIVSCVLGNDGVITLGQGNRSEVKNNNNNQKNNKKLTAPRTVMVTFKYPLTEESPESMSVSMSQVCG